MTSILLKRSGQPPISFDGERIASADGCTRPNEPTRWHELAVYRTASGRYVVEIALRSQWQGETDHWFAAHADTPAEIAATLRSYAPCPPGIGYPPGPAHEDRQRRVVADLRRRYESLVTELFGELGPDFAERVE